MAAISLRRISKQFVGSAPVLRDVNLEIEHDEFCVFLGPSGCGKSTLLRIIAGLEDPSHGEISIGGHIVNEVPPAKRGVAMVFQSYALFPHMTVAENMSFGLKLGGLPAKERLRKVAEAARILQLEPLLDRKPAALSGGQRQRVAIGRAIVREPGVFLFDEPLSNLDATLRGQTRVEIARIHRRFSASSTVYVTHDQVEAMTLADKIVLLNVSRDASDSSSIAQVGAPMDLYLRPNSRFVAGFIGTPQMNFLPATVRHATDSDVIITLNGSGEQILITGVRRSVAAGEQVTLGVRPEHISVNGIDGQHHDARPRSAVTRCVTLVERLGEQTFVHCSEQDGTSILAKVQGDASVRPGELIKLAFDPASSHLFTEDGFAV
ncbi:ATP-binding cassette domain-containing protein [Burkholderia gladioli pv. gladioli]|uniref:ABC transporter ATP-binding protein n=1 Tax=Burkholderia gladioli TaxID=28095 RepID=A0A095F2I4_BURGA|nr:ATP-binding cassette domain-containing protein [Burkholderia gladioli]AJW98545.1 ABC transporter family protein [Burkholderia gladioli]ASD79951.1 ABC transporter ATP-binding protein [Burkholderia gladioli pv. gladioli]AWY56890.1 ABC transporter ATP-binding protein [Burkholderia gladioli pv. gladioli]KGC11548.1 ABC transporter family protein [Burkholderia gladioli]MDJ1164202.1 ATP-binding cassette domain-containing protein [Burkholderia gladioli pv. gladioli]